MFNQFKSKFVDYKRGKHFQEICQKNQLTLDYKTNKEGYFIFKSVFEGREYANYFPFYKQATIIDIGGHFGYFSLFASNQAHLNSKIYTIEPSRSNYNQLNKNIQDTGKNNIESFRLAIGDENRNCKLFLGTSENHSIFHDYSLLNQQSGKADHIEMQTLEQFILNNQIEKVDFLKLDCEGAEYKIIASTPKSIFQKIDRIVMEFHDVKGEKYHPEDILEKLSSLGFEIMEFRYQPTTQNLNYGKIIAIKPFH